MDWFLLGCSVFYGAIILKVSLETQSLVHLGWSENSVGVRPEDWDLKVK